MNFFLRKLNNLDKNTKEVFLKSSSTVVIQVIGVSARLLTSILLGRLLGASGLGDVNLINQIINVLMVFSMFGMDHVLVKKISIGYANKNLNLIGKTIYTALFVNVIIAFFLTLIIVFSSGYISDFFSSSQIKIPLIISVLVLVPQTIGVVFSSAVNGFYKVWQSRFLKDFLTSILVLLGVFVLWFFNIEINLINIIYTYVLSKILTFIISSLYIKKIFSPVFFKGDIDRAMIKMAKPLLFVSATTLLTSSVDIIMLGWLGNSRDVGLYTVATRLVLFVAFFLQITNSAISPKIAAFFANNKIKEINIMVKRVTSGLIVIGFLSTVFFVFFGKPILGLWGKEFIEAYSCLIILCFGQFINISTGCSGVLLIMSGNEKIFSYISAFFLVVNFVLNFVLIKLHGILGAAIATSITIASENIFRVIIANKKTGILTLPIQFNKK